MPRSTPNILVTGTPGVGKSSLCAEVVKQVNFEWIEISKVAKSRECISGYDEELNCPIIDEDKVIDELDPVVESGGKIIEYHGCDFFPERWFDKVFVVRANNTILYDRLQERAYSDLKIRKNIECEIFQSILEEAMSSYEPSIIQELHNNNASDMEQNTAIIVEWINTWLQNNEKSKNEMFGSK
ncbi:adenylate kinase isoenzyme 6 [Planococcus citri]|uniref:adenylate kinase isoenzyme 6 n=1 Tax=Planococcus citri TaxID=170843 RepID=UPI0031FA0481